MKRTVCLIMAAVLLASFFLPVFCGCASNKGKERPLETVDDFMMLSKPENPDMKY